MRLLEWGGNAFDAAVAAGFVLQVVEPHSNGPGGEVSILLATAGRGPGRGAFVVNGQGPAPTAASIDHFDSPGLDLIPGSGLMPACVPGTSTRGCSFAWVRGEDRQRGSGPGSTRLFREDWPSSAAVWLHSGEAPAAGARWRNRDLAATYRRVVAEPERPTAPASGRSRPLTAPGVATGDR